MTATQSLGHFLPELAIIATIMLVFVVDIIMAKSSQRESPAAIISAIGLILATLFSAQQWGQNSLSLFEGMVVVDGFAVFFKVLITLSTLATFLFLFRNRELVGDAPGETYALVLVTVLCCMLLASSSNMLMFYLSLEGISLCSYALAGFSRSNRRASEAALKYVIFGGVASGVMLFGLSYLYGLSGTLDLALMRVRLAALSSSAASGTTLQLVLVVAIVFVIAGIAYKIAAAPFHMWCPDVYEGAPTPVAAIFSVIPKAAGIALLVRIFYVGFLSPHDDMTFSNVTTVPWVALFGIIAAATMTIGNLGALWQQNVKRMLAYSSIAHVGYMTMGFVVLGKEGLSSMLFYMAVYAIMNLGAFFCVVIVRNASGLETLDGLRGLGYREPIVAVCMTVFMLSLTGLPPMAGFIGKYFLFASVLARHGIWYDVLVVVAVVNSAISLFYYARVLRVMYLEKAIDSQPMRVPLPHGIGVGVLAVATILLGFVSMFITPLKETTDKAIQFHTKQTITAQVDQMQPKTK